MSYSPQHLRDVGEFWHPGVTSLLSRIAIAVDRLDGLVVLPMEKAEANAAAMAKKERKGCVMVKTHE